MRVLFLTLIMLLSAAAYAEEPGSGTASSGEGTRLEHSLAFFVGVTREGTNNHSTLGVEYGYRFRENWSVGGLIERAERDKDTTLVLAYVGFFPWEGLFLNAGIGRKGPTDEERNTYRVGFGYEFEVDASWSIAPAVAFDFIEHEENEEVYGIAVGKRF